MVDRFCIIGYKIKGILLLFCSKGYILRIIGSGLIIFDYLNIENGIIYSWFGLEGNLIIVIRNYICWSFVI